MKMANKFTILLMVVIITPSLPWLKACGMKELIIIVSNESSQLGRFAQTDPKEGNIQVPI